MSGGSYPTLRDRVSSRRRARPVGPPFRVPGEAEEAPMIRAIAFDVMDTLLYDPYREALEAALGGQPLAELRARRDPDLYPAFERGELTEDQYWAGHAAVGLDLDREAFHRVRRAGLYWLPGMRELIVALTGHVRLVTASNYPVWIE